MNELRYSLKIFILSPFLLALVGMFFIIALRDSGGDIFFLTLALPLIFFFSGFMFPYAIFLVLSVWVLKFTSFHFRAAYAGLYNLMLLSLALIAYRIFYGRTIKFCYNGSCDALEKIATEFAAATHEVGFHAGLLISVIIQILIFWYLVRQHQKKIT